MTDTCSGCQTANWSRGNVATHKNFEYAKTPTGERFVIKPRRTRFDTPRQQLVIVQRGKWLVDDIGKPKTSADDLREREASLPRRSSGVSACRLVRKSQNPVTVDIEIPKNVMRSPGFVYRVFATDDADKLGADLIGDMGNVSPSDSPQELQNKDLPLYSVVRRLSPLKRLAAAAAKQKRLDGASPMQATGSMGGRGNHVWQDQNRLRIL